MKWDLLFRSMRLRVALFVGLTTSAIAAYYADWTSERSLRLKYKQIVYELRAAAFDVVGFLRDDPDGRQLTSNGAGDAEGTKVIGAAWDVRIFGPAKHLKKVRWAFFSPAKEWRGGNERPPPSYLEHDFTQPSLISGWHGRGQESEEVRRLPRSHDVVVDIVEPDARHPRVVLARARLPEGIILLWFSLESADSNFGPELMHRAAPEILSYGTLAAVLSWWLIHWSLSPMRRIAQHARQLSAKTLAQPIALRSEPAEFDELIRVLNAMWDRLTESFRRVAGFSANASHELKTPIAILQGELELGLKKAPDGSGEQHRYLELLEEVYRLREITETLLALAHSDQGKLVETWEPFDLSATLAEVAEVVQQLDGDLTFRTCIQSAVTVPGDRRLVHQLLMNLGTNAVRHNRPGGRVELSLCRDETAAIVRVSNTGQMIPEDEVKRIFDRFHRVDKARSRATGGNGLGLNLALEIAKAHHGHLCLVTNAVDAISFEVTLPLALPKQ